MKKVLLTVLMAAVATMATAQDNQTTGIVTKVIGKAKHEQSNSFLLHGDNKTVYVINGKVESKEAFDKLKSDNIQSISILKGIEQAMIITTKSANVLKIVNAKITGPSGYEGTVELTVDDNNNIISVGKVVPDSSVKNNVYVHKDSRSGKVNSFTIRNNSKANPLIITRDSKGKIKVEKDMDKINTTSIKSITVYKSNELEQFAKYGDTSNGVIMVELK